MIQKYTTAYNHVTSAAFRSRRMMDQSNMERIVDRSELQSERSSISTSPEPEAIETLKQIQRFDFVNVGTITQDTVARHESTADVDEDEYEFRLFGALKAANTEQLVGGLHKIRLRSPSISKDDAGLIQPKRILNYYFANPLSSVEKSNLESTALTGEEVLAHAQSPWPGSSYSWKVLHLPMSNMKKSIRTQGLQSFQNLIDDKMPAKRKRLGKKYRIKLRRKQAVLKAQQDDSKAAAETKEAAEREKRTRRNREKKVKKKLRDKAKKSAATGAVGDPPTPKDEDFRSAPWFPD